MRRFFAPSETVDLDRGSIVITGVDSEHIARVLRMKPEQELEIADNRDRIYTTRILSVSPDLVKLKIIGIQSADHEPELELTLLQALPKGKKMDWIVRRASELGVNRIIPIFTERTIVRLKPEKKAERRDRWQRIAREAGKQAKRGRIVEVTPPEPLSESLSQIKTADLILAPWIDAANGIKEVLLEYGERPRSAAYFIGPEGGFTKREVAELKEAGAVPVSLGPRIFRTETAGLVVAAILLYQFGEMEKL